MDHAQADSLLKDYFAGRLDRETVRALHGHFKECQACRSRMRLLKAGMDGERLRPDLGPAAPEVQAQIVRNRDLLIKILLLMLLAWFVWKFKH